MLLIRVSYLEGVDRKVTVGFSGDDASIKTHAVPAEDSSSDPSTSVRLLATVHYSRGR